MSLKLPAQVEVKSVVNGRYGSSLSRPLTWEDRLDGTDEVITTSGELIRLASSGQQSTPAPGWTIMLTGGQAHQGYTWTLYGLPSEAK
jgi:hypothetical protein